MNELELLEVVENCLRLEHQSIEEAIPKAKVDIAKAARSINSCGGSLIVTGVGKSSVVGMKIAASFRSIGLRAVFLSAHEMFHGDSGFIQSQDILLAISNSGKTPEFSSAIDFAKKIGCVIIAIVGNTNYPSASRTDHIIDASVTREAHRGNFLPTASSTLGMAIGDALVVSVAELRNFGQQDFSRFHTSGSLGLETSNTVADIMIPRVKVATVVLGDSLRKVADALTLHPHGLAIVENDSGSFFGIVTDGDVRRALLVASNPDTVPVEDFATVDPLVVSSMITIREAVSALENNIPQPVYSAPVVSETQVVGIVTLHLLIQIGK